MTHRQRRAAFDAGWAVTDDPIEILSQIGDDSGDALLGQGVLVARLRGRQQKEILQTLVANERLRQFCYAVDDIDQIEDDAPLGTQNKVEVAEADVEIDDDDPVALAGQSGA